MIKTGDVVVIKIKSNKKEWFLPGEWKVLYKNYKNVCTLKLKNGTSVKTAHVSDLKRK